MVREFSSPKAVFDAGLGLPIFLEESGSIATHFIDAEEVLLSGVQINAFDEQDLKCMAESVRVLQ